MAKRVPLPNGQTGIFPDEMSDEEIQAVIQQQFADPDPGTRLGDFPGGSPFEGGNVGTNLPFSSATGLLFPVQGRNAEETREIEEGYVDQLPLFAKPEREANRNPGSGAEERASAEVQKPSSSIIVGDASGNCNDDKQACREIQPLEMVGCQP